MTVKIGTKFNYSYADGRPTWQVASSRGSGTWNCRIVSEDFNGAKKVFSTEEIEAALAQDAAYASLFDGAAAWWAAQPVGTVLHYHNSFGAFIRGVVEIKDGLHALKATALVGDWRSHDLPRYNPDGTIYYSHNAKQVLGIHDDGYLDTAWQPHSSSIWECSDFSRRGSFPDPRAAEPIDLTLPELTPEQRRITRLELARRDLREVLNQQDVELALADAQAILEGLARYLASDPLVAAKA